MKKTIYRIETDTMGKVKVPKDSYYGAQTQRAVENFPISNLRFPESFIKALGIIKYAAAKTNAELRLVDAKYPKQLKRQRVR
jgi:fumarate hydratase class II